LTYTVGQSQSLATPSLNVVYEEPGATLYLAFIGGIFTVHTDIRGDLTPSRVKHFGSVFMHLVAGLEDRGMDHIDTWVEKDNWDQKRFAEFFGFEDTGFFKCLEFEDGSEKLYEEMRFVFPKEEDI